MPKKIPIKDLLRLHFVDRLSSSRIRKLIHAFKTPERIYSASVEEIIRIDGFDTILANHIVTSLNDKNLSEKVDDQLSKLEKYNTNIVTIWDDDYPENLKNIYNPPLPTYL